MPKKNTPPKNKTQTRGNHLPFSPFFKRIQHKKVVGYSPEFAQFYRKHKRDIRTAYALVSRKLEELQTMPRGTSITIKGVKITKEHTGSYQGQNNVLTLKMDIKDKEFFVRLEPESAAKNAEHVFETVNDFLKEINHSLGEYTIHVMKPHIFVRTSNGHHVISVTDFHHPNEVALGIDLPEQERAKIRSVISPLRLKLAFRGITDVGLHNLFYDPKRKRIILFDLNQSV